MRNKLRAGLAVILASILLTSAGAQEKQPDSTSKQKASAKIAAQAAEHLKKQEWERGIRLLDSALKFDADNINAYWMRGMARLHLKKPDPDAAIVDFNQALKRDEKMAPAYRDRGIAQTMNKNYEKAIEDFTAYLKIRPDDSDGYHERGLAYQAMGKADKAEADFKKEKELGKK